MTIAMYQGTFDPVTNGHMDILRRASRIYDEVVVAVAESPSTVFSLEERTALFQEAAAGIDNVRVISYSGLTVDVAHEHGAQVLVRGLRAVTDFTAEFDMALMNRNMAPEIEATFLMTSIEHLFVSATRVREIASFGRDVSDLVPPGVAKALKKKFSTPHDSSR